jgi:dihydropteroate synthase
MVHALKWSDHILELERRTHVMGVLNVTPDSFSDGGRYFERKTAIEHALQMVEEGADIIDVGGESTRPYSEGIPVAEEMDRVVPVIEAISREVPVPVSIDSWKGEVVGEALKAGASIVNDISALRFDETMGALVARAGVPVILMHMKGTPRNMQKDPQYEDLISEIMDFLKDAAGRAVDSGIRKELIVIDPGIGFGKTFDHNLEIIRNLSRLEELGMPLLLGPSNKAFIGQILDREPHERDTGTMAAIAAGVMNGAHIVRVHNVKKAVETVKIIDAIKRGRVDECPGV